MIELLLFAVSAGLAYLLTPIVANVMVRIGHVRPDVHKQGQPKVPYSGGVALYAVVLPMLIVAALLRPEASLRALSLLSATTIAFAIGLVDDFKVLGGKVKTVLTFLTVTPIVLAHALFPGAIPLGRPLVPFIGRLRITLIYWVLLPFITAAPANVVNMLDVFNGVMPATSLLTVFSMVIASVILGERQGVLLLVPLAGALLGYLPYNRWPARIFNGDSGSLMVGAYIGAAAALLQLEYVTAVALLPHLLNGALIIISVGGFKEHREMKGRPVIVLPDYRLAASDNLEAPISLVRIILTLEGPLSERDLIKRLTGLSAVSAILAVISSLLIPRR